MELSAVGESVFAAESIIKRRIRRVFAAAPPHTHSHRLSLLTYYATIYLRGAIKRCVDNRTVLIRSVFAGSLGISGEMEGLVEEVSIVDESGEDSAPSWPFAQLHLRH